MSLTATSPEIQDLISRAVDASKRAYIPYSDFPVGCALRASDGTVFTGCNIESVAFSPTSCGERTALVKAVSDGYRAFDLCVVVSKYGVTPCGVCRQFLYEFAPDMRVVCATLDGKITHDVILRELLPYAFSADNFEQE